MNWRLLKADTTSLPDVLLATKSVAFTLVIGSDPKKLVIDLSKLLFETPCSLRTTAEVVSSSSILRHCIPKSFFGFALKLNVYFMTNKPQ